MWPAFPTSDYYGSSAPSKSPQLATRLPLRLHETGTLGDDLEGSHVHYESV